MEPELAELSEFLAVQNKQDDRGAAMVAASMIDERLRDILEGFFIEGSASKELLDGAHAPLGTFSARAIAARSLGLIEEGEFREVNFVRKIRNEFAHDWKTASFDAPRIADLCANLPWLGPPEHEKGSKPRDRFNVAIAVLLIDLMWRTRLVKKERRSAKSWPNKTRNLPDP